MQGRLFRLCFGAALRLLFCDEQHPDSVAKEVVALCSGFEDSGSNFDAKLCTVAHNQEYPRVVSRAVYPFLIGTGALAINNSALGGNWDPQSLHCGGSVQVPSPY